MAYINPQGGTKSSAVQEEAGMILSWAELHVPAVSVLHIPGVENWQGDFLCCQLLTGGKGGGVLHPEVFKALCWRQETLDVDVLVSRFNAKLDRSIS